METRNHFIFLGRNSASIAHAVVSRFTGNNQLVIDRPTNVIQSYMGSFPSGAPRVSLFVDGKQDRFPVTQNLDRAAKDEIKKGLNGAHVTIVHSMSGDNTSDRMTGLGGMCRYLKTRRRVGSITVIAPSLPTRDDKEFKTEIFDPDTHESLGFEEQDNVPLTEDLAHSLRMKGVDRLITFTPHSNDAMRHFRKNFDNNPIFPEKSIRFPDATKFLAARFRERNVGNLLDLSGNWQLAVGAPDGLNKPEDTAVKSAIAAGLILYDGTPFTEGIRTTTNLREIPWMFGFHKKRTGPKTTEILEFHGDVRGKLCVLFDDIYSSGGTTEMAAQRLKEEGASHVYAAAVHGDTINSAYKRLASCDAIDEVMVTDTVSKTDDEIRDMGLANRSDITVETVSHMVIDNIEYDRRNFPRDDHTPKVKWAYPDHVQNGKEHSQSGPDDMSSMKAELTA